jgi:hypothetical protein
MSDICVHSFIPVGCHTDMVKGAKLARQKKKKKNTKKKRGKMKKHS